MIKRVRQKNAVDMLKADHKLVKGLFKDFESARTSKSRMKLLDEIMTELTVHATIEEKLVYPLLKDEGQDTEEAYEEHHVVKLLIAELSAIDSQDSHLKAKVKVLSELVEHHIEEEETELLPKLKKEYDVNLMDLGRKIEQMKTEIKPQAKQMIEGSKPTTNKSPMMPAKTTMRSSRKAG